ncbi:MAG: hypothetical protein ACLP59_12935 [Bryobacteraceae bacterium]
MTIDERLERLTERHEALAQSLELMRAEGEQTAARIRTLAIIAEPNEVRAGQMMQAIASLARTVEEHQRRLDQAS